MGRDALARHAVEARRTVATYPVPRGNRRGSVTAVTLRRWTTFRGRTQSAWPFKEAIVWKGNPHRTPGKMDKPL